MRFLLLTCVLALLASGCGQRGPLYLRDNPPPGIKPPKVETYKPVPYPKDAERDGASEKN
jgi:predicted small lipoprotein YifL